MRKKLCVLGLLLGGMLLGLACAAKEEAKPEPAAPAPAAAPAEPAPAAPEAKPAWEEEWERLLAAAKREGRVAVIGPIGAGIRRALTEPFAKRYGITVEFLPTPGGGLIPRLQTERAAGQYLWDVHIGGSSTPLFDLKPMGALEPLEPALILPEVKDPRSWFGGQLPFVDKDRTSFLMTLASTPAFAINTNLAKATEFKSYKDVLDPKWKGKIIIYDPRIPGSGQARFTLFYLHKELGPDYIRALARQEPTFLRDARQQLEWVAQGRFAIGLGINPPILRGMRQAGLPIDEIGPTQIKEGSTMSSGVGALSLVNKAPHPNAAKVYINWLLTKEGQTEFSRGAERPSTRVDAPTDHLEPWALPNPAFFNLDTEEVRTLERMTVRPFIKEVFGE